MAQCPYCNVEYREYAIVGVLPANEHLTEWLGPMPVAQLFCQDCGRYTFMHPDHPDVQRMTKRHTQEHDSENVRTMNVPVSEIGDPELRAQFEHGRED